MKKRLLALILVLVMVLSFGLVACGPSQEEVDSSIATAIEEALADYYAKTSLYTKTEIDAALANKQTAAQVNDLIATAIAGKITMDEAVAKINELIAAALENGKHLPGAIQIAANSGFSASLTFGGQSHCGLAFATYINGVLTFNEALIPNEWALLSAVDVEEFEDEYVTAVAGRNGAVNYFPRFISLMGELWEVKAVTINTTTGVYTAAGSTTQSVARLFRVTSLEVDDGVITSEAAVTNGNCFENMLNNPIIAQAYITMLAKYEGVVANTTISEIKYVKEFADGDALAEIVADDDTDFFDIERLAFTVAEATSGTNEGKLVATATPTEGKIAVGGGANGMLAKSDNETGWAYATTFFKLGSTYSGRFKIVNKGTLTSTTSDGTAYAKLGQQLYAVLATTAGGEENIKYLNPADIGTTVSGNVNVTIGLATVNTGATGYNIDAYTKVILSAIKASLTGYSYFPALSVAIAPEPLATETDAREAIAAEIDELTIATNGAEIKALLKSSLYVNEFIEEVLANGALKADIATLAAEAIADIPAVSTMTYVSVTSVDATGNYWTGRSVSKAAGFDVLYITATKTVVAIIFQEADASNTSTDGLTTSTWTGGTAYNNKRAGLAAAFEGKTLAEIATLITLGAQGSGNSPTTGMSDVNTMLGTSLIAGATGTTNNALMHLAAWANTNK